MTEAADGFKYLGIHIASDPKLYYDHNLLPPLRRLRSDVEHWKSLPLSLLGRAALFKMMSLPRFLYVLHNSPGPVPAAYFAAIEREQRMLLWVKGIPRISFPKLVRGWYDGGICLPDIKKNYWAAQLAAINQGMYRPHDDPGYRMDSWLLLGGS